MSPGRASIAKFFIAGAILCFVLAMFAAFFSRTGTLWEAASMVLFGGAMVCLWGAISLAVATAVHSYLHRRACFRRKPLSDQEFADRLGCTSGKHFRVVQDIRQLAAKHFRRGDRFYPHDRLEEDLHWSDLDPLASEDFWEEFCKFFRIDLDEEDESTNAIVSQLESVKTFGDIVLLGVQLEGRMTA